MKKEEGWKSKINKAIVLTPFVLVVLAIALEVLACFSTKFVVCYTDTFFNIITCPLAKLSGLFSFSIGEFLLYLAVFLATVLIIASLFIAMTSIFRRKLLIPKWYKRYTIIISYIVGIYSVIMVLNCFVLYQYPAMQGVREVSDEETDKLILLRDYVVERANFLSLTLDRDEEGILSGEDRQTLTDNAILSMQRLGASGYPRLSGFYPKYKYFNNPAFFSQQYIMGYYFPFSMEANINGIMEKANLPHTICHELSHLKGYIREDEANFIAYVACVNSGNDYFEYSALLSVINYLDRDFYKAIGKDEIKYNEHVAISEQVLKDDIFLTEDTWNWVNEHSIFETDFVRKTSQKFTDTILTSNGVIDGIYSYSRVVQLLLDYYDVEDII